MPRREKKSFEELALQRELGRKLWKFRQGLTLEQGQKITLKKFAAMFGLTVRQVQSYEKGEAEIGGNLIYKIWKAGHSVDKVFAADRSDAWPAQVAKKHKRTSIDD